MIIHQNLIEIKDYVPKSSENAIHFCCFDALKDNKFYEEEETSKRLISSYFSEFANPIR